VGEESGGDGLARWEGLVDRDVQDESLGVDITNVNTTFVCEQDNIALTLRVDANVVLGIRGMGEERLNDEVVECSCDSLNLEEKKTQGQSTDFFRLAHHRRETEVGSVTCE
jgi:hypothetical protein